MNNFNEEQNELNSLGCPLWVEEDLENIIEWMCEDVYLYKSVSSPSVSYFKDEISDSERKVFPRFGVYSLILQKTPVFVFDNPILEKSLGKTACTDGINIFINLKFYQKLYDEEAALDPKEQRYGIIPLILHEVNHILENDVNRLHYVSPEIANITADLYGNAYLKKSFPFIKWLPYLMDHGYGLKEGDVHYASKTSEEILIEVENKLFKGISPKLSAKEKQAIYSEHLLLEERGRSIDNINADSLENQMESKEYHVVSSRQIIDALKEAGLDHIAEKLGIEDLSDEKLKDIVNKTILESLNDIKDIQNKINLTNENMPTGKAVKEASERIKLRNKTMLTWKQMFISAVYGNGNVEAYNNDMPNDLFYVDEVTEILGFNLYEGMYLKQKNENAVLVILDTSGSMENKDLSLAITEIMNIKYSTQNSEEASEVILVFADASVKENKVIVIDENNYQQILSQNSVEIIGRGGTNLTAAINQSFDIREVKEKEISSVIVFTDLLDKAPLKNEINFDKLKTKKTSFNYINVKNTSSMSERFKKEVSDYANVYSLKEEQVVDLSNFVDLSQTKVQKKTKKAANRLN